MELHLVLAFDASASVNDVEFNLQRTGTAEALRSPLVAGAIERAHGGVAIAIVQWSSVTQQALGLDWVELHDATDIAAFAKDVADMPRRLPGGNTMIHSGLEFADQMLEAAPGQARRRVIDIAANGRADDAEKLAMTRTSLLSEGIVINGLAIEEDLKLLSNYFIQYVIGGPGAFVITANDFDDFGEAMERKLVREISSPQLSMHIEATSSHSYEAMNRQRSCKESVELPSRRGKQSSGQWQRSITPFREKATPRPA
jgi:hypothetical protein